VQRVPGRVVGVAHEGLDQERSHPATFFHMSFTAPARLSFTETYAYRCVWRKERQATVCGH
jgi:hypothetical protein